MDRTFQKFLRSGLDLAPLGVERREESLPYFCTPKGAAIFGWAGVDGIHYCFIRGFGGMVFAVSPMNAAPDCVHPLARDFADFLRLLLACGDAAALEQAWMWGEAQFDAFLRENPPTAEQEACLAAVAAQLGLAPMEHPWAYLRELQASFDPGSIKYTEEYYNVTGCPAAEPAEPDWKVFFDGGFWGGRGNGRAGTELRLETQFDWAGRHWVVPAAYACGKGLVVDVCMRAEADEIRRFLKTWDLSPENDSRDNFTPEQQLQIDLDNPLGMRPDPQLTLNGQPLQLSHGCTVCYNPCLPGSFRSPEAERMLRHYGLDAACGWMLCRFSFLWAGKRRPKIRTLTLTMRQRPCRVPGPHFKVHAPGDSFTFRHPVSGTDYTLQVQELAQETLPRGLLTAFYPTHFTAMRYTLSPAPSEDIRICDCDVGDRPLEIGPCTDAHAPEAQSSAACIVIIGGADGPTALVAGSGPEGSRGVCSALHFEPVQDDVEWCVEFLTQPFDVADIPLL